MQNLNEMNHLTKNKKVHFVIMAVPRSGSNMLVTLLNSHSNILCHHEIFNPNDIFYALNLRATSFNLGTIAERDFAPLSFLQKVWNYPEDASHVGMKITYKQNVKVFYKLLRDKEVKKIILKRDNKIKIFVSHKIAKKLNQWEVYAPENLIKERPKIHVNLEELKQRITFDQHYYQEIETHLKETNQPFLELKYEALKKIATHQKLLAFLKAVPVEAQLRIDSIKQNSANLKDLIHNWEEVKAGLTGTLLEKYLYL